MSEFTGERVIPGAVNDELWAEHVARYAFAAKYSTGARVLDAGCGTGYGLAELARAARCAVGLDLSSEAIFYAREHFPAGRFVEGSAAALPFSDAAFDLVTAFEVIEHLGDWAGLIAEARRVLQPDGIFLVSTPNRLYYTESRGVEGPNPFHVHEFSYAEFRDALAERFPFVTILQQNRTEAFAFTSAEPALAETRADGTRVDPDQAHFFLAVCAIERRPEARDFVYLPKTSNLLRERERHIGLLEQELRLTQDSLERQIDEHQTLMRLHAEQKEQLEERNRWALQLEQDWRKGLDRITELQEELKAEQAAAQETAAGYADKVVELEEENRAKTQWALDTDARLSAELTAKGAELLEALRLLDIAEASVTERTMWALDLQKKIERLEGQIDMVRQSRWVRMGRAIHVGPRVPD